jgi:hypothetical protein
MARSRSSSSEVSIVNDWSEASEYVANVVVDLPSEPTATFAWGQFPSAVRSG